MKGKGREGKGKGKRKFHHRRTKLSRICSQSPSRIGSIDPIIGSTGCGALYFTISGWDPLNKGRKGNEKKYSIKHIKPIENSYLVDTALHLIGFRFTALQRLRRVFGLLVAVQYFYPHFKMASRDGKVIAKVLSGQY